MKIIVRRWFFSIKLFLCFRLKLLDSCLLSINQCRLIWYVRNVLFVYKNDLLIECTCIHFLSSSIFLITDTKNSVEKNDLMIWKCETVTNNSWITFSKTNINKNRQSSQSVLVYCLLLMFLLLYICFYFHLFCINANKGSKLFDHLLNYGNLKDTGMILIDNNLKNSV